ncbi:hypothetical protein ACFFQF_20270 [Haladaptatus pallidirubidus]|uniref:hypothetical protein n=1 Tax=Haladaptatus pallidirubidus TaxID=1008152 RepID=UPI0031EEDE91
MFGVLGGRIGECTTSTEVAIQSGRFGVNERRFRGWRKLRSRGSRFHREGKSAGRTRIPPTQSQLTLFSLLQPEAEGKTPCKRSDIYERYQLVVNLIDTDIVSNRTIHDRISQLRLKGFIKHDERNDGIHGGSYYLYSLDIRQEILDDLHPRIAFPNRPSF